MNTGKTWSILLPTTWSKVSSTKKKCCWYFRQRSWCGKKSLPQTACLLSKVNKYTAELSVGSSCNTLSRRSQMSTEICIKSFTRRRMKRRDRQHSFSISLHFYHTFLESSLQTRFMFDKKKLLLINALTFIPAETQDVLLRIAINLPEFHQIHHWTGDFCNPLTNRSQTLDRPMVSCLGLTIRS